MGMQRTLIGGATLGAGLMYFLDPGRGRRRRALVRDKAVHYWKRSGDALDTTGRNLRDRVVGLTAEARGAFRQREEEEEAIDDRQLADRVRSRMGRIVSHPRAIDVTVHNGHVTLSGPILHDEVERLIAEVGGISGVKGVENRLEVHRERDISSLQGGGKRPGHRWELMQSNWSPSLRFLMSCLGGGLAIGGVMRRDTLGHILTGIGSAALLRAITNLEFKRLFGIGAGRRAVEIRKTLNIDAPVEEVYTFWSHFENFPRFMPHIREVRDLGNGRSHWIASGPAGLSVQWNAVITRQEPNRLIAWRSEPGSLVESAGTVHFRPNAQGGTQLDIQMSYNPPAGALGHATAAIFGSDPRHLMDEDMIRFKSLIENEKTRVGGETVTRDDVISRP